MPDSPRADADAPVPPDEIARFLALLAQSLADGSFVRLLLGRYRGADATLTGIAVRRVALRGQDGLSFTRHHLTRDLTRNVPLEAGVGQVEAALGEGFEHAHLLTAGQDIQLLLGRKSRPRLRIGKLAVQASPAPAAHDREKHRHLDLGRPFLTALGVTDAEHRLIPAMSRKWKQINKFVEILDHALAKVALPAEGPIRVADFGSGKAYLTFAVHDHLQHTLGREAQVTGTELREDLVRFCRTAAERLGLQGLRFEQGDVRTQAPPALDVMIALHACDTATDHAIHLGIRAGARVILCSPCCHKQLRPQMQGPRPLQPLLRHGIHLGQEAEMVTDSLRALLLESQGYETQVFEFVSLEHTNKNKMILAVKRQAPVRAEDWLRQVQELKAFYGVGEQCLETLLAASPPAHAEATAA